MIHVVAAIEIVPGGRDEFLRHFHDVVPLVLAEEGCIEYGPTVDVETDIPAQGGARENVVTVIEKWESLASLQAHLNAPHMNEYRGKVKHLVRGATLQVLQPAERP